MTSSPRRLHPAAVGAEALDGLRALALPIVVVAVLGDGLSADAAVRAVLFGIAGLLVSTVAAYVQWTSTTWFLEGDSVRLRRGVFSENVTSVPLERVQAVDTVRGPVQRLFGVVELHVQAAGGGPRGEIILKAVTEETAEELREAVRGAAGPAAARVVPPIEGQPVQGGATWRLGRRDLLLAALTSGSLGVLVPVVAGASQVFDDVLDPQDAERLVPDTLGEAAVLAGAVLLLAWVLSVLGTIVAFAGFAVARDGERLRIRRGIVERREASVPVARVHAVRVVESPLREPFGLATVRVESAGYAKEPATAQTLLPLVRRRDVERVLAELLPEIAAPLDGLEPLPRRAARRFALPPALAALALAGAAVAAFGAPGLAALALLVPAVAFGLARHRTAGWRLAGDEHLVVRTRGLRRATAAADPRRLQRVGTAVTPLQRRGRLATLRLAVSSGRRVVLPHLDDATAARLLDRLARAAVEPPGAARRR